MVRLIKRYGSRKLYDTQESRYVSLEDLANWVRDGQEVQVMDNATSEDATVATLTQVISEEGRKGSAFLPSDLLHNLIRVGGQAVSSRVRKFQNGVDRLVKNSIDHLVPVSGVREEMELLRQRLDELESALERGEAQAEAAVTAAEETKPKAPSKAKTTRKAPVKKAAPKAKSTPAKSRKTTTAKSSTGKTTRKTAATTKANQGADS